MSEEKPKCFGYFGNPSSVLLNNNECSNCTITAMCEQLLKKRIKDHIKIIKQSRTRETVDFDIFNIGYIMKPTTANKIIAVYIVNTASSKNLVNKSHYCMGSKTCGTFYDLPKENVDYFIRALKEILTNLDNLEPYKAEM